MVRCLTGHLARMAAVAAVIGMVAAGPAVADDDGALRPYFGLTIDPVFWSVKALAAESETETGDRHTYHAMGTRVSEGYERRYLGLFGAAVGVQVPYVPLRFELAGEYRDFFQFEHAQSPSLSGDTLGTHAYSMLGKAYLDVDLGTISGYVGAGAGFIHVRIDRYDPSALGEVTLAPGDPVRDRSPAQTLQDTGFSWSLGFGLSAPLDKWDSTHFDLGYEYLQLGAFQNLARGLGGGLDQDGKLASHSVRLGVRFGF